MSKEMFSAWDLYTVTSGDYSVNIHAPSPKTAAIMGARYLWGMENGRVVKTSLETCPHCHRPVENAKHHVTLENPTGSQQREGWLRVEPK